MSDQVEHVSPSASATKKSRKRNKTSVNFTYMNRIDEDHGQPLYGIRFNNLDPRLYNHFATVATCRATIYRLNEENGSVAVIQAYKDDDSRETFFTCAWSIDVDTNDPLLLCAGENALIKVINCTTRKLQTVLIGHAASVNELRIHPKDSNILLSVSKDRSVRLWNINTCICIAMFAGEAGHLDEVLSGDFSLSGDRIVSSGMDHTIKIWKIDEKVQRHIDMSKDKIYKRPADRGERPEIIRRPLRPFKTLGIHFPIFSTDRIHSNYVDCVRYVGDLLLSKSVEEKIHMWLPNPPLPLKLMRSGGRLRRIHDYKFSNCDIWFVRFALDWSGRLLAVGNKYGTIYLWDTDQSPVGSPRILTHPTCSKVVRHLDFSRDSKWLVASCDNSTVWVWKNTDGRHES